MTFEVSAEQEHDLVLCYPLPLEDVLKHAEQLHAGEPLPDFLTELDMPAERSARVP